MKKESICHCCGKLHAGKSTYDSCPICKSAIKADIKEGNLYNVNSYSKLAKELAVKIN